MSSTKKSSAPPRTTTDPDTVAGDPFAYADQDQPHGCYQGLVYVGHMACDPETGDEVEVLEAVPCKRCGAPVR